MPLSTFEKSLPWSGFVAGIAWIAQDLLGHWESPDEPGRASVELLTDNTVLNTGSLCAEVVMAVALIFFAAALRNTLRSGEAREASYSAVVYGAWLTVAAALANMVVWDKGLLSAAEDGNSAALQALSYTSYFGWLGMGVGISAGFLATGLGGLRTATLPRWFSITTLVLGVLALLGACSIPPGGLVIYLLLPFWLMAAAVIVARRHNLTSRTADTLATGAPHGPAW